MGRIPSVLAVLAMLAATAPAGAAAASITNSGDDLRTGWYPDQPDLPPQVVSGGDFGRLWTANLTGQVYAQPLLADGLVLVATEGNRAYGLDPAGGAVRWEQALGTPWNPRDLGCGDLTPEIGVTSTPVVDVATHTEYLTSKSYVSGTSGAARWTMHALDTRTGEERAGFPVTLAGAAQNAPARVFSPKHQLQRPGLLLLDGVVYAGFGSHCDVSPWQGWIFGVSTAGDVRARWVAVASGDGAGIWQSGSGLMSDGPGRIFVGTGNPGAPPSPLAGSSPPGQLGESIVRLQVQADGTLAAADFFAPFDAASLDTWDADFASGGPVGLPDAPFGTAALPRLAVAVGKQGYVYLLDRDRLGGIAMGPDGSDAVVQRIGPYGGVWSRPGVWPGDGGWVYIPTASGGTTGGSTSGFLNVYRAGRSGTGSPTLSLEATSAESFGFSSSAPVITSDGTTSGSAVVWLVWAPSGSGAGAQLRAYDPVPAGGRPVLRWSAPIGTSAKFAMPGVGAGRVFVGTREGKVIAFGSPVTPPLTGAALQFPTTTVGSSTTRTLVLRANDEVTVSSIASSSPEYELGAASPAPPATLPAGGSLSVPVRFTPARSGLAGATITVRTDRGDLQIGASGTAQAAGPELGVSPPALSFEGAPVGGHRSGTATFRNTGAQPVRIDAVTAPRAPFRATGLPAAGDEIPPGGAIVVTVSFDPVGGGRFIDALRLDTNAGVGEVGLSASAGRPGRLELSSEAVDFGEVDLGASATRTFTIANSGEAGVTVTKSKPPSGGGFAALTELPEGTVIGPGEQVSATVRYVPTRLGAETGAWQLTGDDVSGPHTIALSGSGRPAPVQQPGPPGPGPGPPGAGLDLPPPWPPADPPPAGPAGWWRFSTRAALGRDESGRGGDGRVAGARWTDAGRRGGGLRLDGRGRVTIGRSPALGEAFTLEAWVRPGRGGRGERGVLLAPGLALLAGAPGRPPAVSVSTAAGERTARGARALPAGRWSRLAATWDGAVLRLYVDGEAVGARRAAGPLDPGHGPLRIGGGARGGWFAGVLDEVRIHDRALTAAELAPGRASQAGVPRPRADARAGVRMDPRLVRPRRAAS